METERELEAYGDGYMAGTADGIRQAAKIAKQVLGELIEAIDKGELKIADISEQYGEQIAIAYNKANDAVDELETLLAEHPMPTALVYEYGGYDVTHAECSNCGTRYSKDDHASWPKCPCCEFDNISVEIE